MTYSALPLRPALALALLAAATNPVIAADAGPLEELLVTASRSEERWFDSLASLSIVSEEELQRSSSSLIADALRDVPGLRVSDSGQPGMSRIRIRGEESRRTAVLIDSLEITDHHEVGVPLTLHPSMIERIEVVRGSGAVLYGSRALSGVVNFITRKGGTQPVQATLAGGYDSSTQGYNGFASVYGNLEGFEYRLSWSESDHNERETPQGTIENTAFESTHGYAYAGKTFGNHHFEYIFENFESSSDVFVEEDLRTTFPLLDFFVQTPQRDRRKHAVKYTWEADNNWLSSLETNIFTQLSKRHFLTRTEAVFFERQVDSIGELTTSGALAQLNLQPLSNHSILTGIQYLEDDVDQDRFVETASFSPSTPSGSEVITDKADLKTWAWFAQDQWSVADDVVVTLGLRQYFVDAHLRESNRDSLTPGKRSDSELIGALGAVWEYSDKLRLRANYAQGYVYPSLMQLATGAYAGSSFVNPNADLDPETSDNIELGLRFQNSLLVADITLFYTESNNYIHHLACTAQDNCPSSRDRYYQNVGESQAHGVELYLTGQAGPGRVVPYTNLTLMKRQNHYADYSTWETGIPLLAGRAGLMWQGSLAALPSVWTDLYLRGESDSQLMEPGSSRDVLEDKDSWVTVNLAAGLDLGDHQQFQLAFEARNLTDATYTASGENLYGAGRSLNAKITLNF